MRELPILFSAEMVRALRAGRKTQTRRQFSPRTIRLLKAAIQLGEINNLFCDGRIDDPAYVQGLARYRVGDRLWVKERFYIDHVDYLRGPLPEARPEDIDIYYPADAKRQPWCCQLIPECACCEVGKPRTRSSLFMPRWASRITLAVTGVRAQRVQQISEQDAIAEGMMFTARPCRVAGSVGPVGGEMRPYTVQPNQWAWREGATAEQSLSTARFAYGNLWDLINGEGSWAANPWVWVYTFTVEAQP